MIEFEKSYRGSEEEAENVRSAYLDFDGDMDKIMDEVTAPCSKQARHQHLEWEGWCVLNCRGGILHPVLIRAVYEASTNRV